MQSAYRNDFLWSEGATESIHNIKRKPSSEGFVAPLLPSPAAQSTRTNFSYASDSSYPYFSDAVEGDDWHSGTEGDTLMTTPEKITPSKKSSRQVDIEATSTAPIRPPRRTEPLGAVSNAFANSADDEESIDYASVKTKVWMGVTKRDMIAKSEDTAPPIPTHPFTKHLSSPSCDLPVGQSGHALDKNEASSAIVTSNEIKEALTKTSDEDRLPDGTVKPKMPPIPSSGPRSERGRCNRSPVLSYADGVEEEERLERERDMQEGGGLEVIEMTSSMGPRLKKNSPAPWEMEGDGRNSSEFPSSDLRAISPHSSSSWTRPSMDSIRSRQPSQQSSPPLVPSSTQQIHSSSSSLKPVSDPAPDGSSRRSRSKSVSNSGSASLKGLGVSTTPPLPSKKNSGISSNGLTASNNGKIGKALRGMGSSVLISSSPNMASSTKDGSKKKQGISSDDYVHLDESDNYPQNLEAPRVSRTKTAEGRVVSSASSITITGHTLSANTESMLTSRSRGASQSSSVSASTTHTEVSKTKTPLAERKNRDNNSDWDPESAGDLKKYQTPRQSAIKGLSSSQTNTLDNKRSHSSSVKSGSHLIAYMPTPGSHEGVAYKLISLEEARQQKQSSPEKKSLTSKKASTSDHDLDPISNHKEVQQPARTLKGKRSGLFRMFGKDKGAEQNEALIAAVPPVPTMPTFQNSQSRANADFYNKATQESNMPETQNEEFSEEIREEIDEVGDELGSLPSGRASSRKGGKAFDAPALSLRPMSSMFNGLAPDLLDSMAAAAAPIESTTLDDRNKLRLPNSPTFTQKSLQLNRSSHGSNRSHESSITSSKRNLSRSPQPSPRRSLESMRSETSSSLGLVNGSAVIPNVPNSNHEEDRADLSSTDATQLANSTRSRALEIEAKIADLLAELVKLRSNAMDTGLLSPITAKSEIYTQDSSPNSPILSNGSNSSPPQSNDTNNNTGSSLPTSPAMLSTPLLLGTAIVPCSSCGCNCADQKRLQALNEIAVLKNISVLDRGRALKSVGTTANVGKFGSYLHR